MEFKLVCTFLDETEEKYNLIVNNVRNDLGQDEIERFMDVVISSGVIISKKGNLVSKFSAMVVETTETLYELA